MCLRVGALCVQMVTARSSDVLILVCLASASHPLNTAHCSLVDLKSHHPQVVTTTIAPKHARKGTIYDAYEYTVHSHSE